MAGFEETLIAMAGTPWILLVIFGLCITDGFFPPLPSESIIIAVVALAAAGHETSALPLIGLAAAVGAAIGDSIAYWIGHTIDVRRRIRFFSHGRGKGVLDWAARTFQSVGGAMILAGRYVPVGRVAVNMTAGTVRYPYRRFLAWDVAACVLWAVYTVVLGYLAGAWFHNHPIVGAVVGVVLGVVLGLGLSKLVTAWSGRRSAAPSTTTSR